MGKYEEASLRTRVGVSADYENDDVYVAESQYLLSLGITDRNNGLYAARTYNKGDVIIEYIGKRISLAEAKAKQRAKKYMFDVRKDGKIDTVIDSANNKYSSAAKFVNTILYYEDGQNAEFKQYNQKIYLVAIKKIPANKEILAWYGKNTQAVIDTI